MNILVITQIYPQPDDVGDDKPTRTVEYFAREWVAAGHNVMVFHCPSKFPVAYYCVPKFIKEILSRKKNTFIPTLSSRRTLHREEYGIRIVRFPVLKLFPGLSISKREMRIHSAKICKTAENEGFIPNIVMGHFANPGLELAANVSDYFKVPSSIVFHHDCEHGNIKKYRIGENINRVTVVGARSETEARQIQRDLNLEEKPFICCSGVPDAIVEKSAKKCDRHDFSNGIKHLCVGGLIERKHIAETMIAFDKCYRNSDTKAELDIIGGGPEAESLGKLAESIGNKNIHLLGRKSRDEVQDAMAKANVFTLISTWETFGMVYAEAMLQGCLTVASFGEGFDGIIKDGENGFLCEAGNAEMLAKIYERINNMSSEERNRIGQRAIDIASHMSEKQVAEDYLNSVLERIKK